MDVLTIIFAIAGIIGICIRFYYSNEARKERHCYSYQKSLDDAISSQKKAIATSIVTLIILIIYWIIASLVSAKANMVIIIELLLAIILLILDCFQLGEDNDKYFRF